MSLTEENAFEILQLNPDATKDEIRGAYKRLALEWHPDKHIEDRETATRKFQEISAAYKRLTEPESVGIEVYEMSMEEMFEMFSQIFCRHGRRGPHTFFAHRRRSPFDDMESDDDVDDDDASDDDEETLPASFVGYVEYKKKKRQQKEAKYGQKPTGPVSQKQIEEAEKLASELLKEEEDEKQKAEKKKAKNRKKKEAMKKRRKEKKGEDQKAVRESDGKKQVKNVDKTVDRQQSVELKKEAMNGDRGSDESGEDDIPVWDTTSAFVDRVAQKTGVHTSVPQPDLTAFIKMPKPGGEHMPVGDQVRKQQPSKEMPLTPPPAASVPAQKESVNPIVLKSQQIASRGNKLAQLGHFNAAVDLFTEAIRLYRHDHRYYANRSFCYDHLEQHDRALKDAIMCIRLSPAWPKGFFRKGRALVGLKQFSDAEKAFEQVLNLDKQCVDAEHELRRIRVQQLTDMGFSQNQSEVAIKKYGHVQLALDSLLSGQIDDNPPQTNGAGLNAQTAQPCTLWIGNLNTSQVTRDDLTKLFSQCGAVLSVRLLSERRCGFITFDHPATAATAISELSGYALGGKRLVLRYPDNPAPRHVSERGKQRGGMS